MMPLPVDLPPEIESKAREVAQAEGLDVSALMREAVKARVRQYDPARPLTEADLLMRINRTGFPREFWNRYGDLLARLNAGTITPEEHAEFFRLHGSNREPRRRASALSLRAFQAAREVGG